MSAPFDGVRAVAFDLDGTIIDSAPDLAAAANAMLRVLGHAVLPETDVRHMIGAGVDRLVERTLVASGGRSPRKSALEAAGAVFRAEYARGLFVRSRVYPGVEETLRELARAALPLCCITNKHSDFALPLLEAAGLARHFRFTLCADVPEHRKPGPEMLFAACRRLAVQPAQLLCVGDSATDIAAARGAGCPVAAVSYGYDGGRPIALESPDCLLGQMGDLLRFVVPSDALRA
jgi:phosphoglycolate phosphatase